MTKFETYVGKNKEHYFRLVNEKGPGLDDVKQGQKSSTVNIQPVVNNQSETVVIPPSLCLKYVICLQGLFPSRN